MLAAATLDLPRRAANVLTVNRPARLCAVLVLYVAVTAAWTAPMFFHFRSTVLTGPADGTLTIRGYWVAGAEHSTPFTITRDTFSDAPEGQPYLRAVMWAEPAQPGFVWLFHSVLGYIGAFNLYLILGFVLSGFFGYFLLDMIGCHPVVCFIGGYILAFNPWCFERAFAGHAAFVHVWIQIALVTALISMSRRRRLRDAVLVGAAFGGAWWTADYYGLLASVVFLTYFVFEAVRVRDITERLWTATLATVAGATAVLFLLPGMIMYYHDRSTVSASIANGLSELQRLGANPLAYVLPDRHQPLLGGLTRSYIQSVNFSEQTLFFGYTTLVLAAIGLIMILRRRPITMTTPVRRIALTFGVVLLPVAFWASLRRVVHVFGLPLPGLSFFVGQVTTFYRVYARFGIIVGIALVLLAAPALENLARRGRRGVLVCCALFAILAFELIPGRVTAWAATSPPSWDRWLAQQPPGIVAYYPMPTDKAAALRLGEREIYYQMFAKHPLFNIFGTGIGGTREDAIRILIRYVTDPLAPSILRAEHVRWIVLEDDVYREEGEPPPQLGPPFKLVKRFPNARVYELTNVEPANVDATLEQNAASIALVQGLTPPQVAKSTGLVPLGNASARANDGATWFLHNSDINVKRAQLLVTLSATVPTTVSLENDAGEVVGSAAVTSMPARIPLGPFTIGQGTSALTLRTSDHRPVTVSAVQFQPISDFSTSLRAP